MRWLARLRMRVEMLFRRNRAADRLDDELRFHLEQQISENVAAGMSADEARHAALRAFGNPAALRDQACETWSWNGVERVLQDIRFATRQIVRAPGFAVIAILTLGLGIGANTAVFTLTHALLLQTLPVRDPGELVRLAIDMTAVNKNRHDVPLNLPMIEAIQKQSRSLYDVFAWCVYDFPFKDGSVNGGIHGAILSGNAFDSLGVRPAAGRLLTPADDQTGGGPDGLAAVISYRIWVSRYHADTSVVGRHVIVTDHQATIVGVAPQGFEGVIAAEHPDIYLPLEFQGMLYGEPIQTRHGTPVARHLCASQSGREPRAGRGGDERALPEDSGCRRCHQAFGICRRLKRPAFEVKPARTGWSRLRSTYTEPLLLLQLMVGAVLLICCANLSGLFLARASARRQEFAIRGALGAGRLRLMRQLFVECLMLALPGGVAGCRACMGIGTVDSAHAGKCGGRTGDLDAAQPDRSLCDGCLRCVLRRAIRYGSGVDGESHQRGDGAAQLESADIRGQRGFAQLLRALSGGTFAHAGGGGCIARHNRSATSYRTIRLSHRERDFCAN